jgi:hypothetical protein
LVLGLPEERILGQTHRKVLTKLGLLEAKQMKKWKYRSKAKYILKGN